MQNSFQFGYFFFILATLGHNLKCSTLDVILIIFRWTAGMGNKKNMKKKLETKTNNITGMIFIINTLLFFFLSLNTTVKKPTDKINA